MSSNVVNDSAFHTCENYKISRTACKVYRGGPLVLEVPLYSSLLSYWIDSYRSWTKRTWSEPEVGATVVMIVKMHPRHSIFVIRLVQLPRPQGWDLTLSNSRTLTLG